jgi:hypothetical protein
MADTEWKPIATAPKDKLVLLFARRANVTFDAAVPKEKLYMPVVGYYSTAADSWRDMLLDEGDGGRTEVDLDPTYWTEIPEPFPYPPR